MKDQLTECFKALGDPIRFQIFASLRSQIRCACEFSDILGLEISQPTLSFHLRKLKACGLINETRDGNRRLMSVNQETLEMIRQYWNI